MADLNEIIEKLKGYSTPEICDGIGVFHAMHHTVKPLFDCGTVVGRAVTLELPIGESKLGRDVIDILNPGDVLVIASGGNCEASCWGDFRSKLAAKRGAAAVVTDGAARDIKGLRDVGLPVFARGLCCGAGQKSGRGNINVPVSCAGVTVVPGDIIMGDENGVIVVKPEEAEAAIAFVNAKNAREAAILKEYGI